LAKRDRKIPFSAKLFAELVIKVGVLSFFAGFLKKVAVLSWEK